MSTCRSCGAPIVWTLTDKGRRMPVDQEPNDAGNVIVLPLAAGPGDLHATVLSPAKAKVYNGDRTRLHMPHHATCKQAAQWRKAKA